MRHRHMRDTAFAEEGGFPPGGAVDELIDHHEGAGRQIFPERAAGRQGNEIGDPGAFQHVDVGAVVDVGRREPVACAVARHEHNGESGNGAAAERAQMVRPKGL